EREAGDHRPRGARAIVRAVRRAPGDVIEEAPLDPVEDAHGPAGAVARRKTPAILAVALEPQGIADGVLLLHVGLPAAVLEVVEAVLAHEGVLNAAEVDPDV